MSLRQLGWYGCVRNSTSIPISTGENDFTQFDFRDIIAKEAADILQPDLAVVGGFTAARRVATLAQTANLQCVPHVWGTAILFAASLHLAAAIPNCSIFEFRMGNCGLFTALLAEPFSIDSDGCVTVPEKPGLGIDFDLEEAKTKFPFE
jgi:D-galactarolactone cycloisomerase